MSGDERGHASAEARIEEFRENDGRVGGVDADAATLLLHHLDLGTRAARVTPLRYRVNGDHWAVFGVAGGARQDPDWVRDVLATPETTIEVGTETVEVRARLATGVERDRLWSSQRLQVEVYAEQEQQAGREIPVVVLERR